MADPLTLDEQLCFTLYAASRALTRAYAPLLAPLGITYPQYLVLLLLWETDGMTVKGMGERLALDSGTLTPLLDRLEQQKLVTRKKSDVDRRVVHAHLTAAGKALRKKAQRIPEQLACSAGYDVSDQQSLGRLVALREELRDLVARLAAGPATTPGAESEPKPGS